MAISVDRVYQTVQKILNKEQRGYLPPVEFNLFAVNAQTEIFENYFFELGRAEATYGARKPMYGSIPDNIFEKLQPLNKVATVSGSGNVFDISSLNVYRLGTITANNIPVEYKEHEEAGILQRSPLTEATTASPYYTRVDSALTVYPITLSDIQVHYLVDPGFTAPRWEYMTVGSTPVYNSSTSVNFSLHDSEEPELVAKIATYAGVAIRAMDVAAFVNAKDQSITQSEQ